MLEPRIAEYFNLLAKDTRIAKAHRDARVPTLEQIRHVVRTMPAVIDIEPETHRHRPGPSRPGRARGQDEVFEVVRNLVLPRSQRYPSDRHRLGVRREKAALS